MKYLFIDTAFDILIVSIINNNNIIYYKEIKDLKETSSKIMLLIDEAFSVSKLNIKDIDKIFVVNGPGSFTGIRVGVTIAKTIGYCLNIPLIPISELELRSSTNTDSKYNVVLLDARRDYVYGGLYDNELNPYINDCHILLTDLEKKYPNDYTIINNDNLKIDLLKVIKKHENDENINPHLLNPNYLKLTEAEEKLNDKRS